MVKDIVPELKEQIDARFKSNNLRDRQLLRVSKRIQAGSADLTDAHAYAERLGVNLSDALTGTLTEDKLPNGKLYYNIAERTVIPSLEQNYEMVNEAAAQIQKAIDLQAKIGLGSVRADFPIERIQNLIDKMTADNITYDQVIRWLMEPIVNNSEAFSDDYIRANADFRAKAGLRTKITRRVANNCCDWCAAMAGTWIYGSEPPDIYRRHEYCRCTVTYQSDKISQNVWSKRKWETPKEDILERLRATTKSGLTPQERQSQIEQLQRDADIRRFMTETGYTRETARRSTRKKTPAEIDAEIAKIKERQENIRR
jgi:hypothetical protein